MRQGRSKETTTVLVRKYDLAKLVEVSRNGHRPVLTIARGLANNRRRVKPINFLEYSSGDHFGRHLNDS